MFRFLIRHFPAVLGLQFHKLALVFLLLPLHLLLQYLYALVTGGNLALQTATHGRQHEKTAMPPRLPRQPGNARRHGRFLRQCAGCAPLLAVGLAQAQVELQYGRAEEAEREEQAEPDCRLVAAEYLEQ